MGLASSVALPDASVARASHIKNKIQNFLYVITILAGMVFSFQAHAQDCDPPREGPTPFTSPTLALSGEAGISYIVYSDGGNPYFDASSSSTMTTSGGGSFSTSSSGCQPILNVPIAYYTQVSNDETYSQTGSIGYGGAADIYFLQITFSPKSLGIPDATTSACDCVGNPINTSNGNKLQVETDFVGAPSTQIELRRYYNSLAATPTAFGQSWRSTYDRSVLSTSAGTFAQVFSQDGRVDSFHLSGSVWTTDADVRITLAAVMSGGVQVGWQVGRPDDSVENYNMAGQLTSIVTRAGLTTTLAYNLSNQLAAVTGPFGQTLTYTYNSNGNVSTITIPDGGVYTYTYDAHNNLSTVTYPDTTSRTYAYTNTSYVNALTGITDENGNVYATYAYDSSERVDSSQHAGGADLNTVSYSSNIFGINAATVTDPLNNTYTFNFTSQFGIVKPSTMSGTPVPAVGGNSFSYDANGFISSKTDYDGNITNYTHDSRGDETSRVEAYGTSIARTISTTWGSTFHLPTQITEPNRTTTFTYDANGNMLTKTVTAGTATRTWTYTYNANGQVLTAQDPDLNTTTYTYDSTGDVATKTDALSHVTHYTSYNADGRLLSMTDPNGLVTSFTYDARGRIKTHVVGSLTTSYTYDNAGNLTKVTHPDSSNYSMTYDNAHRLTGIKDTLGNSIAYMLDANSNVTLAQALNTSSTVTQTESFTYNDVNRVLHAIGALGQYTAYTYDNQNNITGVADPLNNTSTYTYDQLNRVETATNPLSGVTTPGYDANDHVVTVEDPRSLTTTYTWNGLDETTATASPDTGSTTRTFDAVGNVLTSEDARGDTTTYTYDALNRPSTITYSDSTSVGFTYDTGTYGKGHLTKMTDPTGSTAWVYDLYGRVTQKTQTTGSVTLITNYSYDSHGRLSTITYPSGNVITYGYDTDGRVSTLSKGTLNLASSITYMPFGQVSGWTEGSTATYSRTIDKDGRITTITIGGTPSVPGTTTLTYAYDNDNNVTSLTDISTTTTATASTGTYTIASSSNHLSSVGSTSYTYDADGNLTGDGSHSFSINARGRLASSTTGGVTTTYGINGLGQRVSKAGMGIPSGGLNEFVYDEQGHLIGEYGSTGTIIEETVYLGDIPVAVMTGTTSASAYQIAPDNINAPHIITNQTGNQVWIWNPLDFGTNAPNQNPSGLGTFAYNFRFPGQYADSETGTNYNIFRDYSPTIGRYIQSDPIGLAGGINTYAYVGNNPLTRVDPWGLLTPQQIRAIFGLTMVAITEFNGIMNNLNPPPPTPSPDSNKVCTVENSYGLQTPIPEEDRGEPGEQPDWPESPELTRPTGGFSYPAPARY